MVSAEGAGTEGRGFGREGRCGTVATGGAGEEPAGGVGVEAVTVAEVCTLAGLA
jgi:hypothetical protein